MEVRSGLVVESPIPQAEIASIAEEPRGSLSGNADRQHSSHR